MPINLLLNLLAVKKGLKQAGRLECFHKKEFDFFIDLIKKFNLVYQVVDHSDKETFFHKHVHFIKYKKDISKLKELIEIYQRDSQDHQDFIQINQKIGRIYGYPECCIKWFIDFLDNWLNNCKKQGFYQEPLHEIIVFEILNNSRGNSFNYVVNCSQNDNSIFHLPHSFNCQKSIKIGKDNLKLLKEYDEKLFNQYQNFLKGSFRVDKNKLIRLKPGEKTKKRVIYFN